MKEYIVKNTRYILKYKDKIFENKVEYGIEKDVKEYLKTLPQFNTAKKIKDEWFRICMMIHKKQDKIIENEELNDKFY